MLVLSDQQQAQRQPGQGAEEQKGARRCEQERHPGSERSEHQGNQLGECPGPQNEAFSHFDEEDQAMMMTSRLLRVSAGLGIAIVLVAAALFWTQGSAAAGTDKDRCNLSTLKGTYVYSAHGVLKDGQNVLPYAEAGNWTLDGAGHAQGVFSASVNGATIASQEAFTATYRHEGNCIYTAFAPVGDATLEFHLYLADGGATMAYYTEGVSGTQYKK
jgi:hypothetical protein